jgi:hypothetical protein
VDGSRRNERERGSLLRVLCLCVSCCAHGIRGVLVSRQVPSPANAAVRGGRRGHEGRATHEDHTAQCSLALSASAHTACNFECRCFPSLPSPFVRVPCRAVPCSRPAAGVALLSLRVGPIPVRRARVQPHVQKKQQHTRVEPLYPNLLCQCHRRPLCAGCKRVKEKKTNPKAAANGCWQRARGRTGRQTKGTESERAKTD